MFTYFWCILELFIGKFIPNINNEHAQDCSCPGATFAFCSHGEKLPRQGGLPGVVQRNPPLEVAPGERKTHVNSYRPCTEAKLTPGSVSCPGAMVVPGSCEQTLREIECAYVSSKAKEELTIVALHLPVVSNFGDRIDYLFSRSIYFTTKFIINVRPHSQRAYL